MENRDVRPPLPKGPVKVKSGDFDPLGTAGPLIDDRPPLLQTGQDPASPGAPPEGQDEPES
jgi:hypothetical protein